MERVIIGNATLHHGEMLQVLPEYASDSIDACVMDPPYGIKFMGKKWDYAIPTVEEFKEIYRVLKPGAHILCACGTRTQHRMAVNIEDAGFEIRDIIGWLYGSGFPKSQNISKAIDRAAGAERQVLSSGKAVKRMIPGADQDVTGSWIKDNGREFVPTVTAPATSEAQQWDGWGTALKPAMELWTLARKSLSEKNVAANVLQHGTGGINIDGCRVKMAGGEANPSIARYNSTQQQGNNGWNHKNRGGNFTEDVADSMAIGRFPANIIHDGSDEVLACFPETSSGAIKAGTPYNHSGCKTMGAASEVVTKDFPADTGSAARFFYTAKCSQADRNDHGHAENKHCTVKPTDLMRYLCRLITPPGGTVLDTHMGSGSTGKAAILEGFSFIGIEKEAESFETCKTRVVQECQASLF